MSKKTNYLDQKNAAIKDNATKFLSHILPVKEDDSDFQFAQGYLIRSINNHRYLDVAWQEVERTVSSLVEKYSISNQHPRGPALEAAFRKYQTALPNQKTDSPYAVISRCFSFRRR